MKNIVSWFVSGFLYTLAWGYIFGAVPLTIYLMWKQCGGFVSC